MERIGEVIQALQHIGQEMTAVRQNLEALVAFEEWRAGVYRQQLAGAGEKLPDNFPAKEQLEAAGITSLDDVPRSAKQLREIEGIGWPEATAVLSALKKKDKS